MGKPNQFDGMREILQRYIHNECTPQEVTLVESWLQKEPALLDWLLPEDEWQEEPMPLYFPTDISRKLERQVMDETGLVDRRRVRRLRRIAIAAALLVAGLGIWLLYRPMVSSPQDVNKTLAGTKVLAGQGEADTTISNSGKRPMSIKMADHSAVSIYPGSSIRFSRKFGQQDRTITLQGEAIFDVARQKSLPFTVIAGKTATTALGTKFLIRGFSAQSTLVRLLQGRVVVQRADSTLTSFKPCYLAVGQELIYEHNIAAVRNTDAGNRKPRLSTEAEGGPITGLDFRDQSLDIVLNQLAQHFNVNIQFDKAGMQTMSFTGRFGADDQVGDILSVIASLNNLDLQSSDSGYTLTVRKE